MNGAPAPPDYTGATERQSQANVGLNRLNTQNLYGGRVTYGPEGVRQELTGPLGEASTALQGQARDVYSSPFSLSGLPQVGTGQEATEAAYRASTARLDPAWAQREEAERTRLTNMGLDPSSEAYRSSLGQLGQQRADAYGQAYGQAVGLGQQARAQDMAARQQAYGEALQTRQQPLQELQQFRAFSLQPEYAQVAGPDYLGAAQLQGADQWRNYLQDLQNQAGVIGGAGNLAGGLIQILPQLLALSDERAKRDIVRHEVEVLPGVQLATWRYKGGGARYAGVIAQDVQRVRPDLVQKGDDGLLRVHPMLAPQVL